MRSTTRVWLRLVAVLVMAGGMPYLTRTVAGQSAGGYGDYVDWAGWARVDSSELPGLASSFDPGGGPLDYNHYEWPTGLVYGDHDVVAVTLDGPGVIYRFWMPHVIADAQVPIRMYFDGEAVPRIDSDTHQILEGLFGYFRDPLVTTFAGGQVSYETIPFRDSLRIETENRSGLQHYYQYGYRLFPEGTQVESWTPTMPSEVAAARGATIAAFENAGRHPAGPDPGAMYETTGPTLLGYGAQVVLADLAGPGLIRRLSIRMDDATDEQLANVRLVVSWDGALFPSIDVPVGWFFGAGDERAPYRSLPMGTESPGGFYCYFPMPFRESAHLQLVNFAAEPVSIDAAEVEYVATIVDTTMGYFHAVARTGVRTPGTDRFVMADVHGTGHYVGNFLFVEQDFDSDYMLEGDEILELDDTWTINGTGLEDAYNGGYYYNWVANPPPEPEGPAPRFAIRPLHGILRRDRRVDPPFARADQYRWMIADRVSFRQSLEISMETNYSQIGSRWESVVFWYQLPLSASDAPPPAEGTGTGGLELWSIEPNPSSANVRLRYAVPVEGFVRLDLIDVRGRLVETLVRAERPAGIHWLEWSRDGHPDGVYFMRLRANGHRAVRKLILLRQ